MAMTLHSRTLALVISACGLGLIAPPAQAWPVRCTYTVGSEIAPAPVRENPDINSAIVQTKDTGETVTSKHSCGYQEVDESGVHFISVNTWHATDEEGWMRSWDLIDPR